MRDINRPRLAHMVRSSNNTRVHLLHHLKVEAHTHKATAHIQDKHNLTNNRSISSNSSNLAAMATSVMICELCDFSVLG